MPDTKSGREKKGLNKRTQLEARLVERDESSLYEADAEPPEPGQVDSEFLTDPSELDE